MNVGQKVVGMVESKGTFTSKDTGEVINYDNILLHTIAETQDGKGYVTEIIKIKRSLYNVFSAQMGDVVLPVRNAAGTLTSLVLMPTWPEVKIK